MIFSPKRADRARRHRRFVPDTISLAGSRLEPKAFAAYFYRWGPNPFQLGAGVFDSLGSGNPADPININSVQVLATAHTIQTDDLLWEWDQTETVWQTTIDSNSYNASATKTVGISASLQDKGTANRIAGPGPFNGYSLAIYQGFVQSGPADLNGNITPIMWQLATPAPVGGTPTGGALPGTPGWFPGQEQIEVIFSIDATVQHADCGSIPVLTLASPNFAVDLNNIASPNGLTITDPSTVPATVIYTDTSFGAFGQASTARVPYVYSIPTNGPYVLPLTYFAQLGPFAFSAPPAPNAPISYEDTFSFNISFRAIE